MRSKSTPEKEVSPKMPHGSLTEIARRYKQVTGKSISPQYIPKAIKNGHEEIIPISIQVVKELKDKEKNKTILKSKLRKMIEE